MITRNKHLLLLSLILMSHTLWAQPGTPPATPIDGGIGALLAGGILYGISRIKKSKEN